MHILVVALFLIHGCHHVLGLPMNPVMPNDTNQLQQLANTCDNSFLVDLIRKKSDSCTINGSVDQSNLECYMFFDINTQLCAKFQHSEFNLVENYNVATKESQNVAAVCDNAKAWKFVTIQQNSPYSVLFKILSDPVNCQKLCGVNELLSDDANFYCTYYKWGMDVIHSHASAQENNLIAPPVAALASNTGKNSDTAPSANTNVSMIASNTDLEHDGKLSKPDDSAKNVNPEKSHKTPSATANQTSGVEKTSETNNFGKITEASIAPVSVSSVKGEIERPDVEEVPPKKDEVEKNELRLQDSNDLNDKGKLEETNPEDDDNENDDYDQHDEMPADNKINKNENVGVESDPEVGFKGNNSPNLKIESIDSIAPQRVPDIYSGGMPDLNSQFSDDDDHFFPIFVTGIVIVVLLYILYHNKTKFTKVILGLIVEGRQTGRRRNSRGHAYRRLDTLEQAMSSNTAAPPSKIIY